MIPPPMDELDDKRFIARVKDLAEEADRGAYITYSDFMDEHKRSLLSTMEGRLPVCIHHFGGFEGAERTVCFFYPEYQKEILADMEKEAVAILHIYPADHRFLKRTLEHRDYLGAILGSGIRREKVGDILVNDQEAYVMVDRTLVPYLKENISSVGTATVMVEEADASQLPAKERGEQTVISVSSLRLDAVVSRGFNSGRNDAAKWITQGLVSKNGMETTNTDRTVTVGDRISVRGKGRMILLEEKGISKSGRKQVLIERFTRKDNSRK